jgi:hypothetical protein
MLSEDFKEVLCDALIVPHNIPDQSEGEGEVRYWVGHYAVGVLTTSVLAGFHFTVTSNRSSTAGSNHVGPRGVYFNWRKGKKM